MPIYKVSLAFAKSSDLDVGDFTNGVITSMTGNTNYPKSPVSPTLLTSQMGDFDAALAGMTQGGPQATAIKNAAREVLVGSLRSIANYVQGACNNDLAILLSSGFQANSTGGTSVPLDKPAILSVENPMSTQLLVRLTPIVNARSYEARISYGSVVGQGAGIFTQARRIVLKDLVPGTTYTVQVRAIGGSTGASDWSDPVSHMSL